MPLNVIFDGDDTLWATEILYDKARDQAVSLIAEVLHASPSEIQTKSRKIDNANFKDLGLSRGRFPKSLVDTYDFFCRKQGIEPDAATQERVRSIGEAVFSQRALPVDGSRQTLDILRKAGCTLYLWTQGEQSVQKTRIEESGLQEFFEAIRITPRKTPEALGETIETWKLDPDFTWLVGNSIRSDINPALQFRLRAIWIPSNVWDREKERLFPGPSTEKVHLLGDIRSVPDVVLPVRNDLEIVAQANAYDAVAYLFVSAYHNLYRQYALDILAYPRGHIFSFPYDAAKWLPAPYRASRDRMEEFADLITDREALVVYVDDRTEGEPRRPQRFIPIRTAIVRSPALTKGGMLHIQFELRDYVSYPHEGAAARYDEVIRTLAARPRPNLDDCSYVSIGPTFSGRIEIEEDPGNDDDAWQSTIECLGRLERLPHQVGANRYAPKSTDPFERAMFYRIVDLVELSSERAIPMRELLGSEAGYQLRGSRNYRLNLLFYSPKRPPETVRRSHIHVTLTSDLIHGIGSTDIPLNFRYDRRHIDFITERVFSDVWTSISLAPVPPVAVQSAATDDLVVAPAPTILLRIAQTRWVGIVAPLAFAVFTMLAAVSSQLSTLLLSFYPKLSFMAQSLPTLISLVGTAGATFILFYLYGKLK